MILQIVDNIFIGHLSIRICLRRLKVGQFFPRIETEIVRPELRLTQNVFLRVDPALLELFKVLPQFENIDLLVGSEVVSHHQINMIAVFQI